MSNAQEFRDMICEIKNNVNNIAIAETLTRKCVRDFEDNNLVNSCLLQYPYGPVRGVTASDIEYVELCHTSDRIQPRTFRMAPSEFTSTSSTSSIHQTECVHNHRFVGAGIRLREKTKKALTVNCLCLY